jgi:hypothetical protein
MGGTYYEMMIKELNDTVNNHDNNIVEVKKLEKLMLPDITVFRGKMNKLRSEMKDLQETYKLQSDDLLSSINDNKKKDWKKLLRLKMELSDMEIQREVLIKTMRDKRKEHYNKINLHIEKKKKLNKDNKDLVVKIFERIRRK